MNISSNNSEKGKPNYKFKVFLTLSASMLLVIGGLLIARAGLIQSPIDAENEINTPEVKAVKDEKDYSPLPSLQIDEPSNVPQKLKNVSSPFIPLVKDKIYLELLGLNSRTVGYIDKNDSFVKLYEFNDQVTKLKLLEDESVVFVRKEPQFGKETLILAQIKGEEEVLYDFEIGETLKDIYYEPKENTFYFVVFDINNVTKLFYLKTPKERVELATLRSFENIEILYLDNEKSDLVLKLDNECNTLSIFSKTLKSIDCNFVKLNSINTNLIYDKDILVIQNTNDLTKTEIQQKSKLIKAFLTTDNIFIIRNVENSLTETELFKVDLKEKAETVVSTNLPFKLKVNNIIVRNNEIYLLVKDPLPKIYKYFPTNPLEGMIRIDDPEEEEELNILENWKEINLGKDLVVRDILFLNSNPKI